MDEISKYQFTISYVGPAVENGSISTKHLTQALSAVTDLFSAANETLNPREVRADTHVRVFSQGSFEVLIEIFLYAPAALTALLASDAITTAANIKSLLFDTGVARSIGLTGFLRELQGDIPKETLESDARNGLVITTTQKKTIEVPSDVLHLFENPAVRYSLADFINALSDPGIHEIKIRGQDDYECRIQANERELFGRSGLGEQFVREETDNVALTIVAPSFTRNRKWRFKFNTHDLSARVEDLSFLERVANRKEQFAAGDTLLCRLRTRYIPTRNRSRREYIVDRVYDHISRTDGDASVQ